MSLYAACCGHFRVMTVFAMLYFLYFGSYVASHPCPHSASDYSRPILGAGQATVLRYIGPGGAGTFLTGRCVCMEAHYAHCDAGFPPPGCGRCSCCEDRHSTRIMTGICLRGSFAVWKDSMQVGLEVLSSFERTNLSV